MVVVMSVLSTFEDMRSIDNRLAKKIPFLSKAFFLNPRIKKRE